MAQAVPLTRLLTASGAAGSPEEAGHLCEALRAAGVVVRVGSIVFLRPDEVAETILKVCALPQWIANALLHCWTILFSS